MPDITRALVRVIHKKGNLDDHRFAYGAEDHVSPATWRSGFLDLFEQNAIPGDPETWLAILLEKMQQTSGPAITSHYQEGWLVMLRFDVIDSARIHIHANDNHDNKNAANGSGNLQTAR